MEEVGGNVNAMTSYDFTAYVDDVPPRTLPLAIALEADRMVNLALTHRAGRDRARRGGRGAAPAVEDNVERHDGRAALREAFKMHPYRWPMIGWMKDIKGVIEKAVAFYSAYYAPNNAVLIITGNIDPATTLGADRAPLRWYPPAPTCARALLRATGARPRRRGARGADPPPCPPDPLAIGCPGARAR